jgi:drug/metabolite transporter (DMT)-like permease
MIWVVGMNRHLYRRIGQFILLVGVVLVVLETGVNSELRQDALRLLTAYPLYSWGVFFMLVGVAFIYLNRR